MLILLTSNHSIPETQLFIRCNIFKNPEHFVFQILIIRRSENCFIIFIVDLTWEQNLRIFDWLDQVSPVRLCNLPIGRLSPIIRVWIRVGRGVGPSENPPWRISVQIEVFVGVKELSGRFNFNSEMIFVVGHFFENPSFIFSVLPSPDGSSLFVNLGQVRSGDELIFVSHVRDRHPVQTGETQIVGRT